ncbi:hypothetical protein M3Y95_00526100 [Aphelenchoides besseyi]|nr:hypothetical protein M3Y95_00526100 [Aphelenchoides besseyi]
MFLRIHLHDNKDEVHRSVKLKFEAQTTIEQLEDKIQSVFLIAPEMQQILDAIGRRIDLLKHADLNIWIAFSGHFDSAKNHMDKRRKQKAKENVKFALELMTVLKKNNFSNTENYASILDCDDDQLKNAAILYFLCLFKDDPQKPSTQVVFSPKPNTGAQGGFVCSVKRSEEILGKYFLKTHSGISNLPSGNQPADLCELLIYKRMHLVRMGQEVHFLANAHTSCSGTYIATKEVPSFRPAATKKLVMPTSESYKLDMLRIIFYLRDLESNNNNYGLDGNDKLCIVDFHIGDYKKSIKSSIVSYLRSNERVEVYETCMEEWKLADVVKKADVEILCQKLQLKTDSIAAGTSKSYTDYLKKSWKTFNLSVKNLKILFNPLFSHAINCFKAYA